MTSVVNDPNDDFKSPFYRALILVSERDERDCSWLSYLENNFLKPVSDDLLFLKEV